MLAATLDEGGAAHGLLIVSGGNEIRIGAHRGMALLAQDLAREGYPVLRFDRRGVGDSEGENGGFRSSGPDIAAAITEFRELCPQVTRILGFGNCDAATALVLHDSDVDARLLANPWVVEPVDALPPPAAIEAHYARRVRDPKAWAALLTGTIDFRKAAQGLGRIASPRAPEMTLAQAFATDVGKRPTTILLAERDNTAVAFADAWAGNPAVPVVRIKSASHSFASDADYAALLNVLVEALAS